MKIFILQAISFTTPTMALETHATIESVSAAAARLVNDLLKQVDSLDWDDLKVWPKLAGTPATAETWKERLLEARKKRMAQCDIRVDQDSLSEDAIGDALGDDNGDVWIIETELQGELPKQAHIEQFLDLSTAHLSPAAKAWLSECGTANHAANYHDAGSGGPISTLGTTMHGWFMHAPHVDTEGGYNNMPADLVAICDKALAMRCNYILFDADADAMADIPVFENDD